MPFWVCELAGSRQVWRRCGRKHRQLDAFFQLSMFLFSADFYTFEQSFPHQWCMISINKDNKVPEVVATVQPIRFTSVWYSKCHDHDPQCRALPSFTRVWSKENDSSHTIQRMAQPSGNDSSTTSGGKKTAQQPATRPFCMATKILDWWCIIYIYISYTCIYIYMNICIYI
jgi:hypothetical protein